MCLGYKYMTVQSDTFTGKLAITSAWTSGPRRETRHSFEKQRKGQHKAYYGCAKYFQTVDRKCAIHFIRYEVLYACALDRLQLWSALAEGDEQQLLKRLLQGGGQNRAADRKKQAAEL